MARERYFSTHTSAGLLTTGLTAILWALQSECSFCALFAFGAIGLTHGIVRRNLWDCVFGFALSFPMSSWLMFSGPRCPYLDGYFLGPPHLLALFFALLAASFPLRDVVAQIAALVGAAAGTAAVAATGLLWQMILPSQICVLEVWEFLTILCAVPIAAVCTWWPVDYAIRKTAEYEAKVSSGQAEPPT